MKDLTRRAASACVALLVFLHASAHPQLGQQRMADPSTPHGSPSPRGSRAVADKNSAADLLWRASQYVEEGRSADAIPLLESYLQLRPQEILMRLELAELFYRQRRHREARQQFEAFVAMAQPHSKEHFLYLVHSHSRLVEIAELQHSSYQEHLNRGIGLLLLADRRASEPKEGEHSVETLLCRAAGELQEARTTQPGSARVHWYLYRVWTLLGQHSAAQRSLARAEQHGLTSPLTPTEKTELLAAALRARPQAFPKP